MSPSCLVQVQICDFLKTLQFFLMFSQHAAPQIQLKTRLEKMQMLWSQLAGLQVMLQSSLLILSSQALLVSCRWVFLSWFKTEKLQGMRLHGMASWHCQPLMSLKCCMEFVVQHTHKQSGVLMDVMEACQLRSCL